MPAVERHCDRAILLEAGRIERAGDPGGGRPPLPGAQLRRPARRRPRRAPTAPRTTPGASRRGSTHADGEPASGFAQGEEILLEIVVEAVRRLEQPVFGFQVVNADGLLIFAPEPIPLDGREALEPGERARVRARIANPLAEGHYYVHCAVAPRRRGQRPGRLPQERGRLRRLRHADVRRRRRLDCTSRDHGRARRGERRMSAPTTELELQRDPRARRRSAAGGGGSSTCSGSAR